MDEQKLVERLILHAEERLCVLEGKRVAVLAQLNEVLGGIAEWRYLVEQLQALPPAEVPQEEK